jgi:hypothetical protein
MDRSWIDAARSYNSMNEQERHAYWNQLTPEQQTALTEALAAVAVEAQPRATAAAGPASSESQRRGPFGTFAIGCTGFLLGVILTVAVEVAAVAKGISAMGGLLSTPSESTSPREEPQPTPDQTDQDSDRQDRNDEDNQLDCRNPKNAAQRRECSQQRYRERKEEWESRHPGEEYPCEAPLTF